jgi:hypothetical protein
MELVTHTLEDLFAQLGLPNDRNGIAAFVSTHRPLRPDVALADASCWSAAQAQFLREEIAGDADWAEVVDQLNVMLRA